MKNPIKRLGCFRQIAATASLAIFASADSALAFKAVRAGGWNGQYMDVDPQLIHML